MLSRKIHTESLTVKWDIILIEAHAHGPDEVPYQCTCNCTQYEYIPMEYWQANFDAIQTAVANGIIVVEAGGNGSMDLDHERYDNRFDRSYRDSGAILVGAATSSVPLQPMCWTNYESHIDVHAWGENVMTTGYGYHFDSGTDDCQDYKATFGGTSSASPMIVGAAANIQGILRARGDLLLSPAEMRAILANIGNGYLNWFVNCPSSSYWGDNTALFLFWKFSFAPYHRWLK